MKVYLDDIREAPDGWIRTISVETTIELLEHNEIEEISLDHDLSLNHYAGDYSMEATGYDVLVYLEERCAKDDDYNPPTINIHTGNPSAEIKMKLAKNKILKLIKARTPAEGKE